MDAPPPYSETDPSEYSATATSHSSAALTPSSLHTDPAPGRPLPSTASSVDDVIFTPPYSPALLNHAFTNQDNLLASSSAAAFFDSRPATIRNTGPPIIYSITVNSDTQHKDLPFPDSFQAHGVLDQDWHTFVNYLLPDQIISASKDVTDRKHKIELVDVDEGMQRLGVEEKWTTQGTSSGSQPRSSMNRERTNKMEATIMEWNEGFFKPRGLQITTIDVDAEIAAGQAAEVTETSREPTPRVPGAWIPHDHIPYDHEILGGSSAGRKRGFFGGFKSFQGSSQGGFRMGPIVADNDGFRMGNMFVADQNGVRLGGKSFRRRESNDPERGRGASNGRHRKTNRSSSISSSFSSSSDSSTDSDTSIGSLPEYDDLRDQQLFTAKQSLVNWLNHPEQPLTKGVVQQIRHDIQFSMEDSLQCSQQDLNHLRREVRDLMKEFREGKRRQKRDQKQARRERRALKRAQRIERRAAKREARRLKREGKNSKGKEPSRRPPWMTSKSTAELLQPPPMPPRPAPDLVPGFPFTRAASVPYIHGPQFGGSNSPRDPIPSAVAMHSTWPYARDAPYSPGNISASHMPALPGAYPNAIADSSEQLYAQAKEMEGIAQSKEELAIELRTEATGRGYGEKDRLKKFDQATALEEEAEKYIMEADRLRGEALHLDSELARELEETNGRENSARVIQN